MAITQFQGWSASRFSKIHDEKQIRQMNGWSIMRAIGVFTTTLAITQPMPGFAASDIAAHWAQSCLAELETRNILQTDGRDRLRPDQPLTRGDFATIIAQAFGDRPFVNSAPEPADRATRFLDVTAKHINAAGVARADRLGFLDRYVDRVFYPDQYLNRWELWTNVIDGLNLPTPNRVDRLLARAFDDEAAIPTEVRPAIASAVDRGWIANDPDPRQLSPNATATRADLAVMICRIQADQLPADVIPRTAIASSQLHELRGVWLTNIDSTVLFSRRNLDLALTRLADLQFNTVYPTVWNWGYTLYPSAVAEATYGIAIDPHPGLRRRDMLAEAVDRGHELGLRVIPWFEFGFQAPSDSELAQLHPDWLTQKADGSLTMMEGEHERVWLNPFNPEVQQFILDLVVELVENYDIDGIQFDDHMGLPVEYGYDPYTIALYRAEHDGNDPPDDPHDPAWVAWRADKITQFMRQLFFAVKAIDNEVVISVAPNPQEFAYSRYLQDWERWERMGIVEELIVQLYRRNLESFEAQLNTPELLAARDHIPTAIGVLAGLRDRPADTALMVQQVETVRENEFDGVAFFFYESLWQWSLETPEEREAAIEQLFEEEAIAPTVYEP
ncbi:MAG: family 10 glycosylhydrolase [Coleofasciculaceae cyanobacterium RL_1_1]|nr:family 10 glycosylhydrolase [Coleofasciculaceae cyanobacterium RL_1_1]